MRGARTLTTILAAGALGATFHAERQEPTFSAAARTVAVYATVSGPDGRLLTDLERDDFVVEDAGEPQPLTIFANDIQPITAVILLDRSASMRGNFALVSRAAEEFVDAMLPTDRARIGSFSNRIQVDPRHFTSDRDELRRILREELQDEGPTPLWNAVSVGITGLMHEEGRRVVLVFSDGVDSPGNGRQNNSSLADVSRRAEAENVMVYSIGLAANQVFGRPVRRGSGGFGGSRRRGRLFDEPDPGLAKIAAATGGGYFELTSTRDLASTFRRVAEELHHQYALGFTPTVLDGKTHPLEVRVVREGAMVRARKSYVASRG
jgi:Ca-activated chloride channel family protein